MVPQEKMVYVLAALIFITSMVYIIVAWEAFGEMASAQSSEEKMGSNMEIALFSVVGVSYLMLGAWILRKRLHTSIPYVIVAVGSGVMIGIYMVAITAGVPVLGVESEADPFATIAKTLQGGIIGIAAFLIPYTIRVPEKMLKIKS
ncbi:MAG TPA: hypothetical protein VH415_10915 [Nitrososphaeraceae archaeon]|jgi:hypothetical protein